VAAAAPELLWGGIITQRGEAAETFQNVLSSQNYSGLLAIQLVGVDVAGVERLGWFGQALAARALGGWFLRPRIEDELDATAFLHSLVGDDPTKPWTRGAVNPLFPFVPPARRAPGRPRA